MIDLPRELWISIFEFVESIPTLWEYRFLSHKLRPAALFVLNKRAKSDKNLKFTAIIENIHTSENQSFLVSPESLSSYSIDCINFGAKGLSNQMANACHNLHEKNQDASKSLDQVLYFLKNACTQVEKVITRGTLSAYNSIFRYFINLIFQTYSEFSK
jgi:hypothetical protein